MNADDSAVPSWFVMSNDGATPPTITFTANPEGETEADYEIKLTISSVEHSDVFTALDVVFTVTLAGTCDPTPLTAPTPNPPDNIQYSIGSGDAQTDFTIPAWTQSNDCTYTEVLTLDIDDTALDWITFTAASRLVSVIDSDTAQDSL